MKNFIKISFFVFLFFIVSSVYADTFTYVCEYKYDGVTFKYQVSDLDAEYIKSASLLESNSGKLAQYVSFWYKSGGQYVQLQSGKDTNKFDGRKSGKLRNNVNAYGFLRASISNNSVKCPTVYRDLADGYGGTPVDFMIVRNSESCNDLLVGCDDGHAKVSNVAISSTGMSCMKNNDTSTRSSNCDSLINRETLHSDTNIRECEYTANNSASTKLGFRITYNKTTNDITFKNLSSSTINNIWVEKDKLIQDFKNASSKNGCPTYISCDMEATNVFTSKYNLYIGPMGMTQYTNNKGSTKKFGSQCGTIMDDNGEKVNNTSQHQVDLALNGSTLDISDKKMSCDELLQGNLQKVLHLFITAVRIAGAIIAIVMAMLSLIPAITSDDAGALKKAIKKCIYIAVVLVAIGLFPTIVGVLGRIAGFDLTCL